MTSVARTSIVTDNPTIDSIVPAAHRNQVGNSNITAVRRPLRRARERQDRDAPPWRLPTASLNRRCATHSHLQAAGQVEAEYWGVPRNLRRALTRHVDARS